MDKIQELYKAARVLGVTNRAIAKRARVDLKTLDNVVKGRTQPHAITLHGLEESLQFFLKNQQA
jgi:predicted transcriptional regulator